MSRVIKIELNIKSCKITLMRAEHLFNQLNWLNAIGPCFEHNGRTVRIIGTDITRIIPDELLETDPGICLNDLQHMTEMNWAIRIR